jgi:predicted RNase H-like HicB family nuclease
VHTVRHYTVILKEEPEGGFSVWVPALPGCASQGETREEALANIREAMELYIDTLVQDGLALPPDVEVLRLEASA